VASSLSATILATLQATYSNANALSTPSDSLTITQNTKLTNGVAANQGTKLAYGQLTFTAGQTQTLNLASLTDPFGSTFSLVNVGVKGLLFINTTATAGAWVTMLPGATNGWVVTQTGTTYSPFATSTQKVTLGSNGMLLLQAPQDSFAVPDSSHCQIDIYSQLISTVSYAVWG
jgi:hypothetical protein